ncbi:16S rRNA (guanine(527)-N(7))-methyltransferase RsmG [Gracilimonas sediminicola]|uniref:Ribosomal RNA small subunit methyltransferase G n=1 Tax=Gracilimonas sediminicola TaxID=2952158 RepID=A0A9X2L2U3_9BACT|nr:class I SAM-dependent methyltransferase [Gracilimonas sediminicola]
MEHQILYTPLAYEKAENIRVLFDRHEKELEEYISRLLWWNKKINLVSRDVSRETIKDHVEHSLVLTQSELFEKTAKVIDSGTGGGLPGMPLAICYREKQIHLNDVVTKKVMACRNIASALSLKNISTSSCSIEKVGFAGDELLVSKHAFKIGDLLRMLESKPWGNIILLKGGDEIESELEKAKEPLKVNIIDLMPGFDEEFYKGKAMVEISRISQS